MPSISPRHDANGTSQEIDNLVLLPEVGDIASGQGCRRELETCLLETQRQIQRLEEIMHRLRALQPRNVSTTSGMISLLREGTRRLAQEVDEFNLDSHVIASMTKRRPGAAARPTPGTIPRRTSLRVLQWRPADE